MSSPLCIIHILFTVYLFVSLLFFLFQLLDMLKFYARFEINDQTGDPLTDHDMMQLHYDRITALQKAVFVKYSELRRFALTNVASINTREALTKHFESLRYVEFD